MVNILIVEDNEINLDLESEWLEREGHQVTFATNGIEGVKLAKKTQPDIILMDIYLPELNGIDATKQLKNDEATAHIPILIVTAFSSAQEKKLALEVNADGYVSKPINFDELFKKITVLTSR